MYPDQKRFTNTHVIIPADNFADEIKNILRDVLQEFKLALTPNFEDNSDEQDELLTRKQACQLLGISLPTLSKYVRSGKLPYLRIGKKILFDKVALLKACKVVKQK